MRTFDGNKKGATKDDTPRNIPTNNQRKIRKTDKTNQEEHNNAPTKGIYLLEDDADVAEIWDGLDGRA